MRKIGLLLGIMLLLASMTSCAGKQNTVTKEEDMSKTSVQEENKQDEETERKKEDINEEENNELAEDGDKEEKKEININVYFADAETGEMISKAINIEKLDAQLIWKELQKADVINSEAAVLGLEVNENEKTINLDLDESFGEQLRSMGTTGEKELLNAIVYTYLEAYGCDRIKLTEESGVLTSGHREYTEYLTKE